MLVLFLSKSVVPIILVVWQARGNRLWKRYVRMAAALAGVMSGGMLLLQYFILLPPFAWFAKRTERREAAGWTTIARGRNASPTSQY